MCQNWLAFLSSSSATNNVMIPRNLPVTLRLGLRLLALILPLFKLNLMLGSPCILLLHLNTLLAFMLRPTWEKPSFTVCFTNNDLPDINQVVEADSLTKKIVIPPPKKKKKFYILDTIINHGWQYVEPLINLPRILELTGPRKKNETEKSFLNRFLVTRRQLMCCYPDDVWPPAADRVADLQRLVSSWSRNKNLEHPVTLKIYGVTVKGTEDLSYDKAECPKKPKGWKLPAAKTLPIPDTCPNKLLSL